MEETLCPFEVHELSELEKLLDTLTDEGLQSFLNGNPEGIVYKKDIWFSFFKTQELEIFMSKNAHTHPSVIRSVQSRIIADP